MEYYIAQTAKPATSAVAPTPQQSTFSLYFPFFTAILGLFGGVLLARYSSYLTQKRENAKKVEEKLDEGENMKMGAQILEAVSHSHGELIRVINDQGTRLDKAIADQGTRLDARLERIETQLESHGNRILVMETVIQERLPRQPVEVK